MSHVPLIEYTTKEVYQYSDSSYNSKYRPWTDRLLRWLGSNAGCFRKDLEMIGTFIWICANECRDCLRCERVLVAMEGDQSRFLP